MATFAERLKELRKQKGLTQVELAAIVGVERSSIGKYEGQQGIVPSAEVLNRIATYFGVSIDYLMGYSDNDNSIKSNNDLSDEEKSLVDNFRQLNENKKAEVMQYLIGKVTVQKLQELPKPVYIAAYDGKSDVIWMNKEEEEVVTETIKRLAEMQEKNRK